MAGKPETVNIHQVGTAKAAMGGGEGGEEAFRSTAHGENQGGHQRTVPRRNLGPGSPDWVPTTAEDEPPAFARYQSSCKRANLLQYSGRDCPRQRLNI
jgi:hypothetical protein